MPIHISRGNKKIGYIPNISLDPRKTCPDRACRTACYAMKRQCAAPGTRNAWAENYDVYDDSPNEYFKQIDDFLRKKKPPVFRFHVGGDIPDGIYLERMRMLASDYPDTQFFCYTKAWYDRDDVWLALQSANPRNLKIWLSQWREYGYLSPKSLPPGLHGVFETVPIGERIPPHRQCSGYCPTCTKCWTSRRGSHLMIHRH